MSESGKALMMCAERLWPWEDLLVRTEVAFLRAATFGVSLPKWLWGVCVCLCLSECV